MTRFKTGEQALAGTWFAGMSKGTLLGELHGVTDLAGEQEFFIRTAATGRNVRCIFSESRRGEMKRLLSQPVRIGGLLSYDGTSPHAVLVEVTEIYTLNEDERPHLFDNPGLFRDSYYPSMPEQSSVPNAARAALDASNAS